MSRSDRFLKAIRGEAVDTTPIWIMRQAGRYLPEYRATRAKAGDFLTLCKTPELACEVTLQPIDGIGVDAAILFSDILIPLEPMGVPLAFADEEGRASRRCATKRASTSCACPIPTTSFRYVMDAIRLIRRELDGRVPLIGFAGAPFTLLTYVVEGQTGKQFAETKKLLFGDPTAAHALLAEADRHRRRYLRGAGRAGAQAVQLFDSWVGQLGPEDFRTFAAPYVQQIVDELKPLGAPIIYFANDGGDAARRRGQAGRRRARRRLAHAARRGARKTGDGVTLQGNLDPCLAVRADPRDRAARGRRAAARRRQAAHLQPRSRHPAGDAARACRGARRRSCIAWVRAEG